VDLSGSVAQACEQGRLMATAKQIRFDVRLPQEPVWLLGDASALRRLFLILPRRSPRVTQ
jgi:hypothetical protein